MKEFNEQIKALIDEIENEESSSIDKACEIIFEAMKKGIVLHVFATGHSHMFAEELFYRAGGLVQVNPILEPFLMQHEGAVRSTQFERLTGVAEIIFNSINRKEGEPFLIVSNSGINCVPVEMAELALKNGHPVITLTSFKTSKDLKARTLNGKKLYEVSTVSIDNHAPYGDGVIKSKYGKIGSTSTILNSYIAQSIVLKIVELYEKEGLIPPIYHSANLVGGDEHNKKLYEQFKSRIKSLY